MEFKIEMTPMWPACWYGGPYWNGNRTSNATCYFHRTKEEAESFVEILKKSHAKQLEETAKREKWLANLKH